MSKTPKTDAKHTDLVRRSVGHQWVVGTAYVEMREHAEHLERELARALLDRDNALELAAKACVDEVNRNMDEYTRLPENVTRRVIYAAMGVAAANCRDSIREIIDAASRPNPPHGTEPAP